MDQFEMVKLGVDIGLGVCLLYLAFRFFRGGISDAQARQLATLDASLKGLIREAEVSGNNLNDQLLRRQQSLESALRDTESSDGKLQRSVTAAKDLLTNLDQQLKKVREEMLEIERQKVRLKTVEEVSAQTRQRERVEAQQTQEVIVTSVSERKAVVMEHVEEDLVDNEAIDSAKKFERVNIYGEPISGVADQVVSAAPETDKRSLLQKAVEKIVEKKRAASGLSRPALDAIHAAAEEMLRSGKNLEAVAARTKLSLDEVRVISQRVIRDSILEDSERKETRIEDQRLGVLASGRQQQRIV